MWLITNVHNNYFEKDHFRSVRKTGTRKSHCVHVCGFGAMHINDIIKTNHVQIKSRISRQSFSPNAF